MISFFVNPISFFCHLCQHEAIKIFQGPRPISQWWQKYGAQREKDGTRCHFLQIDFLIHPITWRQYGLDYNSEWHSMICTRGDWKNSFDVFSKQSWEEDAKKYGRVFFFFSTFKSILWKFLRSEFGHNFNKYIFKPFPGIRKRKGASLGSGTNRVSYLPTNYILFPALNVFLQLSTNLTYLMPIDLVVLFDIGVVSITGNLFYNLCFLSEIF